MFRLKHHWHAAFALSCLGLIALPAQASVQDEDSAPTLEEAVQPTQEELDAVGGLPDRGQPTLEKAEPGPAPSHQTSSPPSTKRQSSPTPQTSQDSGTVLSLRLGGGLSMINTPAFNDVFSVRDDSPSQGIYGFTAAVDATEQQVQLGLGVNMAWQLLPKTEAGFNVDVGFAPLGSSASVISFTFGPALSLEVADDIVLGSAVNLGYLGYHFGFTVEAEDDGDAYMTFKDEDIWFDSQGEASMSMNKGGFVMAPEVSIGYRPTDGTGVVFRAQYLMHTIDENSPWSLTFSETTSSSTPNTGTSETSSSATISYEGGYVAGTPLPKAFNFSGLMFLMEVQFTTLL
ncbi:MAG: hypothetical protein VX834_04985 [Myxococcota bacterium]|nr:hypothetical protein [Myxococcota bacterium]